MLALGCDRAQINYKLAGGAGYSPHQDAPAYPFINNHISVCGDSVVALRNTDGSVQVMIAVDDATLENGCLWVADGKHQEVLPMNEKGCVRQDVVDSLPWHPVELKAGACFHNIEANVH